MNLVNQKVVHHQSHELGTFIKLNKVYKEYHGILLGAGKVYMRVMLRRHFRGKDQQFVLQITDLETCIVDLEQKGERDEADRCHLSIDRASLNQLYLRVEHTYWIATQRWIYEWGDKSSKLLYWLPTHGKVTRVILNVSGVSEEDMEIPIAFSDYYRSLYVRPQWLRRESLTL
ncbi:hypothetical protein NDU88_006170 [Pleurodeles waltl]|uniref:Uncharacterized protein n=1 Tax=Pleurodeles waltl TaxID=8319 RepID=A0AAV7TCN7_PLEWA|nr:hypothetical protein NDU88_006170 [Pleurodeles waltl]